MWRSSGVVLGVVLLCTGMHAVELQVSSCDPSVSVSPSANVTVEDVTGQEGAGAKRLNLPATSVEEPHAFFNVSDASQWPSYEGLRFWVKSDSGATWGMVAFIYSGSWYRYYAGFPITGTWTEVTIPWREFFQRNYQGPIEDHLSEVHTIDFTVQPTITKDNQPRPARSFDVDDIRVVDGLSLSPTPTPSMADLPRTRTITQASQALRVMCIGTSITYGLKLSDRTTEAYPALLEGMLESSLGYSDVTVINFGLGGKSSWHAGINLGDFFEPEAPDLIIVEFMYNDAGECGFDTGRKSNYRDNIGRLLDLLLRWDQADIMVMYPTPHAESGNTHLLDDWVAELEAATNARNLAFANVYDDFMSLSEAELIALYASGDPAHPNAQGHQRIAQVTHDAIMGYLESGDSEPPTLNMQEVSLSGTVTDAGSVPPAVTIAGVASYTVDAGTWSAGNVPAGASPRTLNISAEDASGNTGQVQLEIVW